jgi:hypothetical protein
MEVIGRRMLERVRKFGFQHPVLLLEFSKLLECGHVAILLSQIVA